MVLQPLGYISNCSEVCERVCVHSALQFVRWIRRWGINTYWANFNDVYFVLFILIPAVFAGATFNVAQQQSPDMRPKTAVT